MAIAYLNEGAVSLAAANWSDATGFANAATLVISSGSQTITTSLDQSGLSGGIDTLDILPGFTGRIGGAGYGSLKVDADEGGSTHRIIYNAGGGSLYLQAGGDNTLITNFWMSSLGSCYLTGGTFTNVVLGQGSLSVDSSTVLTDPVFDGGAAVVQAGTAATSLTVRGGSHVWNRGATTINVYGRGRLNIDCGGTAITTLNILSSEAEVVLSSSGTITTVNNWGRLLADKISRAITISTYNSGPAGFLADSPSYLTRSAIGRLGAKNI